MKNKFLAAVVILASIATGLLSASIGFSENLIGTALLKFILVGSGTLYILQYAFGISLYYGNMGYCTTLVGLKRRCNKVSIGGVKRLYIVLCEDIASEFITFDLAMTSGEYTGAIPLVATKKFIEIEAWYDTTKVETEMKAGAGFTQGLEFKVLGYDKEITKLMALLYETPVNVIVQGNDNQLYYLGQKYIPLIFDAKGIIPEKGTARKEVTFMAKNEGFTAPVFPLAAAVTFEVTPLAA